MNKGASSHSTLLPQTYDSTSGRTVEFKLGTLVDFPVHNLDMAPYLQQAADLAAQDGKELERLSKQKTTKLNGKKLWSKIKGGRGWGRKSTYEIASPPTADVDAPSQVGDAPTLSASKDSSADKYKCIYDLYAVVNHYGGLSSGHYTATCRSTTDTRSQWYHLDDNTVSPALERNLKTRHAYILCYTQREAGREMPQNSKSLLSLERMHSANSCRTDYDAGDTCHFTIDAYSASDTESWKSVTSLAHRIKVDSASPGPQHLHATTTSPQLKGRRHTHCAVDSNRSTGVDIGGATYVMMISSGGVTDVEQSPGSPESTIQSNALSSSDQDLQRGPAQSGSHQEADLSVLIRPCLDTEALPSSLSTEGGECLISADNSPKVAWLSDSSRLNLRDKQPCEAQQSKTDKGKRTVQPYCQERPATDVESDH